MPAPKKENKRLSYAKKNNNSRRSNPNPAGKSQKTPNNKARTIAKAQVHNTANKSDKVIKPSKAAREMALKKEAEKVNRELALEELRKAGELLDNQAFLSHVSADVGPESVEILRSLAKSHKTDEELAAQMSMKVNDIRRMLNMMNSYSIVRYDVNKDNKGWLLFTWRIDGEKLQEYIAGMSRIAQINMPALPANCNDFFICKKCYATDKIVLPFDSAFETKFTCGCGKSLTILNKEETIELFREVSSMPS